MFETTVNEFEVERIEIEKNRQVKWNLKSVEKLNECIKSIHSDHKGK